MKNEHASETADYLREIMPENVRHHAELCRASLYGGPLYLDAEGDECSPFDEGATPHDFATSLRIVRDWTDEHVQDVTETLYHEGEDDEGELVEWEEEETVCEARDVARELFGALASYL